MNETDILATALQSHAYLVAIGAALVLLVSLGRLPVARPQWERLPTWARPLVPVLLGLLAGVGEALATSRPWLPALVSGVVAGLPALLAALPSQVVTRSVMEAITVPVDSETASPYTGRVSITRDTDRSPPPGAAA